MSEVTKHEHGTPSWADLGTTDGEAAVGFYAGLFGWEAENTPAGPAGTYVLCRSEGKDVVGIYEQDPAMRERGVPPMWLVYVSVDDASAAAVSVQEAGGTIHAQPFDVGDAGRMALVQDPTGAMFGLWEAKERVGAQVLHEPGSMDWFELATDDAEKAGAFYEQVFGWEVKAEDFDGTEYTTCTLGETPVAGILPAGSLPEGVAPNWGVVFAVENCATTVEKATSTGAQLLFGPEDMPSVGQFAGLRDPQGAAFGVIQPAATEEQAQAQAAEGGSADEGSGEGSSDQDQSSQNQSDQGQSDQNQSNQGGSDGQGQAGDGTSGSTGESESKSGNGNDADSDEARVGITDSPDSSEGAEPTSGSESGPGDASERDEGK